MITKTLLDMLEPVFDAARSAAKRADDTVEALREQGIGVCLFGDSATARLTAGVSLWPASLSSLGVKVAVAGDDGGGIRWTSMLGPLRVVFDLDGPRAERIVAKLLRDVPPGYERLRETVLEVYPTEDVDVVAVRWALWINPDDEGRSLLRNYRAHPLSMVFGDAACTTTVLEARDVKIPMPEGDYDARATREFWRWDRPRWPGPWAVSFRVSFDIPGGIHDGHRGGDPIVANGVTDMAESVGIEDAIAIVTDELMERRRGHAPEGTEDHEHPLCWRHSPRIRRSVPFLSTAWGVYVERWDPFAGLWESETLTRKAYEAALARGELDEPACGCCGAEYGTPCRSLSCSNNGLRCPARSRDPRRNPPCPGCAFCDGSLWPAWSVPRAQA